jgi:hypothetical protein
MTQHEKAAMNKLREKYLADVLQLAVMSGVEVNSWEVEEIEMAFEKGFQLGIAMNKGEEPGAVH